MPLDDGVREIEEDSVNVLIRDFGTLPETAATTIFIAAIRRKNQSLAEIEEERRLFYVGMTRAKEPLYLTSVARCHSDWERSPSMFISEIPSNLIDGGHRLAGGVESQENRLFLCATWERFVKRIAL